MKAVVVGGGIGGLATAIALRQAGLELVVVERAAALREHGYGLVVAANAVAALGTLGVLDEVRRRAALVLRAEVRNPRGEVLTRIPYADLGWETYGILRSDLLELLVPEDVTVRLGARCIGVEGTTVLLDEGEEHGDLVVGADGIHSTVRESLFGPEPLRYGGHRAWRASVAFELPAAEFVEVWGVGGGFGFGPAGSGRAYWYCFERVPEGAPPPADIKAAFLSRYGDWFDPIP